MGPESFVAVIGSGAAGTACARTLADAGVRTTVVEQGKVGGTCLWQGCMPKKALYRCAQAYLAAAEAAQFGTTCEHRSLDWEQVLAWKWHAQESYAGDQEAMFASHGIEIVRGTARFEGPGRLRVDGHLLEPTDVVIASGSAPVIPPVPGAASADTSEEALHYPCPPASLAIVGGGYIAFEFAGIYAAFGTKVTMLVRGDRLLPGYDPEIVAIAVRRLAAMGVDIRLRAVTESIDCAESGSRVTLGGDGGVLEAERVVLATGRAPRIAELDPAAARLALDARGNLVLDPLGRTSDPHVWAAGDARGDGMHTPLANAEGRHVALAMLGEAVDPLDTKALPTAVFTFPQLAQAGITEGQARAAAIEHVVHRQSLDTVGAAIIEDERDGLVKVVADPGGRLIGAQIAAPTAADLIYPYAVAIQAGLRLEDLQAVPAIHPSMSQAVEWAAW